MFGLYLSSSRLAFYIEILLWSLLFVKNSVCTELLFHALSKELADCENRRTWEHY